ncbi:MAG: putative bifunctional diguanylate cyclase/phosphodiesterase [Acidiferrobacterales bacterium]
MIKKLSIKTNLYIIAALYVASLAGFSLAAILGVNHGAQVLTAVYENNVQPLEPLLTVESNLKEIQYRMAGYLLDQMPAVGNRIELAAARKAIPAAWAQFRIMTRHRRFTQEDQHLIASVDTHITSIDAFFAALDAAYAREDRTAIESLLEDRWPFSVYATVLKPVDELVPRQQLAVGAAYRSAQVYERRLGLIAFLSLTTIALLTIALIAHVTLHITRSLSMATAVADRIADDSWDDRIDDDKNDEVGQLLQHLARMRDQLRARQERLETILDNAAEAIITFDENGVIESFSQAAERLFGYSVMDARGADISLLIPPPNPSERRKEYVKHLIRTEIDRLIGHEGEVLGRHKTGESFPLALKISKMTLQGKHMYVALAADISERKALIANLKRLAEHDGLTGLYNRAYFVEELERVVARAQRGEQLCALLYIDLDNFKYVNDTLGHAAGDRVLIEAANIMRDRARSSDLISRHGGDEFAVLLYSVGADDALRVAESFRNRLSANSFRYGNNLVNIGCSIGLAMIEKDTKSASDALAQADIACHMAKRHGRNRVHAFDKTDSDSVTVMSLDMGWSRRIRQAIDNDRFVLAYQPIVRIKDGEIERHEVLLRMLDDHNELIMPQGFLPSAERFGLAVEIDMWVIAHAVDDLAERRKARPSLRYSINLSGQSLSANGIFDLVRRKIEETGVDPTSLSFEVTETAAIADMTSAVTLLSGLRSLGCQTALDDFGAGMSSFAYLQDLPVDCIKIDGRFVRNIATNPVDKAMVKAMNEIAHTLGKQTVAEFADSESGYSVLKEIGVDYGQGFLLGRPMAEPSTQALPASLMTTTDRSNRSGRTGS